MAMLAKRKLLDLAIADRTAIFWLNDDRRSPFDRRSLMLQKQINVVLEGKRKKNHLSARLSIFRTNWIFLRFSTQETGWIKARENSICPKNRADQCLSYISFPLIAYRALTVRYCFMFSLSSLLIS